MSPLVTREALAAVIRALCRENPDTVNPVDRDGNCVYTAPDDPDRHCLIGAALIRLGLPCPTVSDDNTDGAATVLLGLGVDDFAVGRLADEVQGAADGVGSRRPWGEVLAIATRRDWL